MRVGVRKSQDNILKWKYLNNQDVFCHCGQLQMMTVICPTAPENCIQEDLILGNLKAKDTAQYWVTENI